MENIENYYKNFKINNTEDIYKEYDELMARTDDELREYLGIEIVEIREIVERYWRNRIEEYVTQEEEEINDKIERYRGTFNYYPELGDKKFMERILNKKEFWIHRYKDEIETFDDKCAKGIFELLKHQIFLKNYISPYSPYNSILLFHGVGVGKTCSAITIAETFKDIYKTKEGKKIRR